MKHIYVIFLSFGLGFGLFFLASFRFGYHPQMVRVAGARGALSRAIAACYTGDDNQRTAFMICVQKRLISAVGRWGMEAFLTALDERLQTGTGDGRSITQCHDLTHAVGWAGVVVSKSIQKTLPRCTNLCVSGCQHGAIAAWYATGHDIVGNLSGLCTDGIDWSGNPEGRGGCFHEAGHALASIAGNDMYKAFKLCDGLPDVGRIDCGYGVFMELFEPATFATAPQPLPANHPYWCATLSQPYQELCFDQAGENLYARTLDDTKSFAVCDLVPKEYTAGCMRNLGLNIFYVYQYKPDRLSALESFCRRSGVPWFASCLSGVLTSSVFVEPNVTSGVVLCRQLASSERAACFATLGEILTEKRTPQKRETFCHTLSPDENSWCMNQITPSL